MSEILTAHPLFAEDKLEEVFQISEVLDLEHRKDGWWIRIRTYSERRDNLLSKIMPENQIWKGPYIIRELPSNYDEATGRYYASWR